MNSQYEMFEVGGRGDEVSGGPGQSLQQEAA